MEREKVSTVSSFALTITIVMAVVLPVVLGQAVNTLIDTTFVSIPLHSLLEASGGVIAIVISTIIYIKYRNALRLTSFNWATTALLAMGIIDIFHASVMPGKLFVWLHSIAVFFGGLFFMLVWIKDRDVSQTFYRIIPQGAILFSVGISTLSLFLPDAIPSMFDAKGNFSSTANWLNVIGGLGFFIAGAKFLKGYFETGDKNELLLAGHTLLFGIAGILFLSSVIWDMQWWLWHTLRLIAYILALYFLYIEFESDIAKIEHANAMLKQKNDEVREYLEVIDENVITSTTDINGTIVAASSAFAAISGYDKSELIGRSHNITRHPDMPKEIFASLWKAIKVGASWQGEIKNLKKDGTSYWVYTRIMPQHDEKGDIVGYASIREDITDRKRIEEISITDELTGLYNRRYFNRVIVDEINRVKRDGKTMALMMIDVDYFKAYNDTYGHFQGDLALKSVAEVLLETVKRSGDFAFRIGGEEFAVIIHGVMHESAVALAELIRTTLLERKIEHAENPTLHYLSVSIGLVSCDADSIESEEHFYKAADDLLYRAKENGRNRVEHTHITSR
jgi:diguanylate cyclase (GGDEF)-like protein/PAS domain S-box-containing protein